MAALDYLLERGFSAKKQGMRVRISPASKLTDDVRKYVKLTGWRCWPSWRRTTAWSAAATGRYWCRGAGHSR